MAFSGSQWASSFLQQEDDVLQDPRMAHWEEPTNAQSQFTTDDLPIDLDETAMEFIYDMPDSFRDFTIHGDTQDSQYNAMLQASVGNADIGRPLPRSPSVSDTTPSFEQVQTVQPCLTAALPRNLHQPLQAETMNSFEAQYGLQQATCQDDFGSEAATGKYVSNNFAAIAQGATEISSSTRKKRTRFSKVQTMVLQAWMDCHLDHPYPNTRDMMELCVETNLDLQQIRNWFSRYRQRKLVVPSSFTAGAANESNKDAAESSLDVVPTDTRDDSSDSGSNNSKPSTRSLDQRERNTTIEPLAPSVDNRLAWWIRCLPADVNEFDDTGMEQISHPRTIPHSWTSDVATNDSVDSSEILRAPLLQNSDLESNLIGKFHGERMSDTIDASSENGHSASGRSAFSGGTVCSGRSALSQYTTRSQQSARSATSSASAYSSLSFGPRKGRRRAANLRSIERHSSFDGHMEPFRPYECCYCGKSFPLRSTCKRHERAVHAPEFVWICGRLRTLSGNCVFCVNLDSLGFETPSACPHKIEVCCSKPDSQVTFHRRDNFAQHLRGVHKLTAEQIQSFDTAGWIYHVKNPNFILSSDIDEAYYERNGSKASSVDHPIQSLETGQQFFDTNQTSTTSFTELSLSNLPQPESKLRRRIASKRVMNGIRKWATKILT